MKNFTLIISRHVKFHLFCFLWKTTFEHREVAIENKTSISAISYQETRRVRQRTGAHGWQSLSSLSRQTSDKHQKFLDRYLVCQENFGFYYIQQGQISDKCRIYRIYQIYLFIQLKRIFIYLFQKVQIIFRYISTQGWSWYMQRDMLCKVIIIIIF